MVMKRALLFHGTTTSEVITLAPDRTLHFEFLA
jgi:hypothetical protein